MVDKIIELTDTMIVGVKNVTVNEYFFQGHFPGQPSLSGKPVALLAGVWLAARMAWLADAPLAILIPLELAFPLLTAAVMGRLLWRVKQQRNYPIVGVLALLAVSVDEF